LIAYNKKVNVTAITALSEVLTKHFIDSFVVSKYVDVRQKKMIDVGTGAGFPGVPLKIMEPSLELTLLDSLGKRVAFLNELLPLLNLECEVVYASAREQSMKVGYKACYDIVVSRAVMDLEKLIKLTTKFLKCGGHLVALKGHEVESELNSAQKMMQKSGLKLSGVDRFSLPNSNRRSIVILKKF
jgi:16S rRNA (guanine527-N7)-methyltransferase